MQTIRQFIAASILLALASLLGAWALPGQARSMGHSGEAPAAADVPFTAFLPLAYQPQASTGIYGQVTDGGAPAAGVVLTLRFFDGQEWSTAATTLTDSSGAYQFSAVPSLQPGQGYYVLYLNPDGQDVNRLWTWHTATLKNYTAGSSYGFPSFDLANVALISPPFATTQKVPLVFQWARRPATPQDSYEFNLVDPGNLDNIFYTDPPLGYVDQYTLSALPAGYYTGMTYFWELWVYSPDGGFGVSYEARRITFSSSGAGDQLTAPTRQPAKTGLDRLPR